MNGRTFPQILAGKEKHHHYHHHHPFLPALAPAPAPPTQATPGTRNFVLVSKDRRDLLSSLPVPLRRSVGVESLQQQHTSTPSPSFFTVTVFGSRDNVLTERRTRGLSKGCEFESRQERREHFLLQS